MSRDVIQSKRGALASFTRTLLSWCLTLLVLGTLVFGTGGCKRPYRVGEYVLVEWEEGSNQHYPAYILQRVSETRYRVHFDGYDSRFDEDVYVDRIVGRVEGPAPAPPPPKKVARAAGATSQTDAGAALAVNPYKPGDRIRVRWRGSAYGAVVLEVEAKDRVRVRYEGYESAWDETVPLERIVGRR